MTLGLLLAAVTAIAYGATCLLASVLALFAWRLRPLRARIANDPEALVALRLLPSAAGLGVGVFLVLPAFLLFEPKDAGESAGPLLGLLALAALLPAAAGACRGARAAFASRGFAARRAMGSRAIVVEGAAAPSLVVEDEWSGVAVTGIFRARLLIARRVLDALSSEELQAVVAHENEHVARRDNLRHWLLRSAPDWLALSPVSAEIERAFSEATEREADRGAMRHGPRAALSLASALVTVARLTSAPGDPTLASALHSGSAGALTRRVLALTAPSALGQRSSTRKPWAALLLGFPAAAALLVTLQPAALAAVHGAAEVVVRLLI